MKKIVPALLALSLSACQNIPSSPAPAPSAEPTVSASAAPVGTPPAALNSLTLQGQILMPSGLQQVEAGILMPSGIVIPSGILKASSFQLQSTDTPSAFDNVPFQVKAYDAESGEWVAETESNGEGQFVFQALPAGRRLLLQASALRLPDLSLQALANLPEQAPAQGLNRNISAETLAALLLLRAAQSDPELAEIPAVSLQNETDFAEPVKDVAAALTTRLGQATFNRIDSLNLDPDPLRQRLRDIVRQRPALREPRPDPLADPNFFPRTFDPRTWPRPTRLFPPPQPGQENPPLPDGTCPPPPPRPDGSQPPPPEPLENGNCPPPPEDSPALPGASAPPPPPGSSPPPPPPPGSSPPPPPPPGSSPPPPPPSP